MCTFFLEPTASPPDKPQKIRKIYFYVETLRKKNRTYLVQNRSIEFEVVRLDRFPCPIALSMVVKKN